MCAVESPPSIQRPNPASDPDTRWFRLAMLLTGNAVGSGEILGELFATAPHELAQLRTRERRTVWMIRQIRLRALKWRQGHPTADASCFAGRVAALPEPSRSLFALFHCFDENLEILAETLGLGRAAAVQELICARQALAPGTAFPERGLLPTHRPWGGDAAKVAKARRTAPEDPQLAAQIAADLQWHEEIERIEVPEAFSLLHLAEPPKLGWGALFSHPAVLAIVLAFGVVVGVLVHLAQTRMGDFTGKEAVGALVQEAGATNGSEFEVINPTDAGKLDDWFVLKGFEGYTVPRELQKAKAIGCRVFKQEGMLMAEVAFQKQNARLLVFRAAELKNGMEKGDRRIFQQGDWAVAAWNEQENGYVVMFEGDSDEMPGFLQTAERN